MGRIENKTIKAKLLESLEEKNWHRDRAMFSQEEIWLGVSQLKSAVGYATKVFKDEGYEVIVTTKHLWVIRNS